MATTKRKPANTEVLTDETTTAKVRETQNANGEVTKVLEYNAPVKIYESTEDETAENSDESENENGDFSFQAMDFSDIPKDKIDIIFDDIEQFEIDNQNQNGYYFAKLTRIPDAMTDSFYLPCNNEMPLGVFQFSINDRFSFVPAMQKQNNNSGGRFNIQIFDAERKLLKVFIGYDNPYSPRKQEIYKPVGASNILIPNPVKEDLPQAASGLESVLNKMIEMQRESNQQILNAIRQNNSGKTTGEFVQEIIAIKQLFPEQKNDFMQQLIAAPVMMETFALQMRESMKRPEPVPPQERTGFDKFMEFSQTPLAQNLIAKVSDIAEAVASAKIAQSNPELMKQLQANNEAETETEQTENGEEMKLFITDLKTALESDTEINADNAMIQKLAADFGESYGMVKMLCQSLPFENVFQMLLQRTQNIQPYPFNDYLDLEQTQIQQKFVWNERGQKALVRLEKVYLFLKEN
jgi:hypothetical protein